MADYTVYPKSQHEGVFMARDAQGIDFLMDGAVRRELNHETACFLRERFLWTAPVPVLRRERTVGVGDRLGIACPGHLRVFEKYDATPVLAQQSIRELNLTGRTYNDVLDCVTFAVFREDFQRGFGADGDHLKQPQEVEYALTLGYSMITLDCSEHIHGDGGSAPIPADMAERYLGRSFDVGEGIAVSYTEEELGKILHTYGEAIDFAVKIYDRFFVRQKAKADFEISIDETATPTTPAQHFFVANELTRRGVKPATVAPRFCGEFQKGIDYIGDLEQFDREMIVHAAIARHFGYKLSIHSGSDKFSAFPSIGKHTHGVFHLKTAGTNWLEAMKIVAEKDPALYREVHAYALNEAFGEARKYYHVTTNLNNIPSLETLTDAQLPELFSNNDARQLIHITYGLILNHGDFAARLYKLWDREAEAYAQAIEAHIGKHLQLLQVPLR